jgi:hypothetical protein
MELVDLLTTIIAVATVVAIALGAVAFLTRRLTHARRSAPEEDPGNGHWYFVRYVPDGRPGEDT